VLHPCFNMLGLGIPRVREAVFNEQTKSTIILNRSGI
jgi:hypothetical protein